MALLFMFYYAAVGLILYIKPTLRNKICIVDSAIKKERL